MDYICRKLNLLPGERVVDIGCGWGALAFHMARHYGANVQAVSNSHEQILWARHRAAELHLTHQVEFIEDDYRNISAQCDALVSVGMLEHVGAQHYRDMARVIHRVLDSAGRGLIQTIGLNQPHPFNLWTRKRVFPGTYAPTLRQAMDLFEPGVLGRRRRKSSSSLCANPGALARTLREFIRQGFGNVRGGLCTALASLSRRVARRIFLRFAPAFSDSLCAQSVPTDSSDARTTLCSRTSCSTRSKTDVCRSLRDTVSSFCRFDHRRESSHANLHSHQESFRRKPCPLFASDSPVFVHRTVRAAVMHVSGREVAKTVVVQAGNEYFLAVMPASYHVNVEKLASAIGHPTRLATEGGFQVCSPIVKSAPFRPLVSSTVYAFLSTSPLPPTKKSLSTPAHTETPSA